MALVSLINIWVKRVILMSGMRMLSLFTSNMSVARIERVPKSQTKCLNFAHKWLVPVYERCEQV